MKIRPSVLLLPNKKMMFRISSSFSSSYGTSKSLNRRWNRCSLGFMMSTWIVRYQVSNNSRWESQKKQKKSHKNKRFRKNKLKKNQNWVKSPKNKKFQVLKNQKKRSKYQVNQNLNQKVKRNWLSKLKINQRETLKKRRSIQSVSFQMKSLSSKTNRMNGKFKKKCDKFIQHYWIVLWIN